MSAVEQGLLESSDDRQGSGSACYLASGATTVNAPELQGESGDSLEHGWWTDLDRAWAAGQVPRLRALRRRARRRRREGDRYGYERLMGRALSIAGERQLRVESCQRSGMTLSCKCGPRRVAVGCGQRWLCGTCRARFYQTVRRTALASWRAQWDAHRRWWQAVGRPKGGQWRYFLLRLSVRHSGDVAADRETIVKAWAATRSWLWSALGRYHPHYAVSRKPNGKGGGVAFPYQLTWETTPGSDGQGHVHAHVIVLWPWFDWSELHAKWIRETGAASNHVRVEAVRAGQGASTEHARARDAVVAAADYVAKYATKGVDVGAFDGALAGRILVAFYAKRIISASRGFLRREPCRCPECRCRYDIRERPRALRKRWEVVMRLEGATDGWADSENRQWPELRASVVIAV